MEDAKTLKEWRELRGLSAQEVADRVGVDLSRYQRWEEVGFDWDSDTREGAELLDLYVAKLMRVFGLPDEGLVVNDVPSKPNPGDLVVRGVPEIVRLLSEYGDEINPRMAVPTRWGIVLKPTKDVTFEDHKAIGEHAKADGEFLQRKAEIVEEVGEFIEAQQGSEDEDITLGEAAERHERGTKELRKMLGEEVPEVPKESAEEEPRKYIKVPRFYPVFDKPGAFRQWDDSKEAWAWKAERDFFIDCEITAAARFYSRVRDWSLVPELLEGAGWEGDVEYAEEFVEEHRAEIEARLREIRP